ncbi:Cu(I)-responsive transcriptional regulator [Salinivibrio proteolyticus]|uniref:Cu(I)-responsive transcriptional regulator n=1 Tax=Salinivibrio TaxID=51366 RepID=UPI000985760A|nr:MULTISPECIES: Cu(I)-responsive transcriptional regulator [Salinivibrio]OOF22173.1 Cu(I)-responsive transcriptional regulator [Salinivibrio proteolyticus]OOF24811.1 Cu(I)-responsive transcriptional regulator [Salinivibrio sp. IB872]PCE69201.1 Cu(I)-responsive transcriptional regulator [Salinivibrio sp. YCSC6]QCF36368.1 Cu(I)-responsive transcriptional regulator [Salinivibrio sp. YCSC6]
MKIQQVAEKTGLTTKTIRFYEQKGLITPPHRADNGYRDYRAQHVSELQMIRRARLVGFTLEESADLLALSRDPSLRSADVKARAESKLMEIDEKIAELAAMKTTLQALTQACPGDGDAQCPIIEALRGDSELGSIGLTESQCCQASAK